MGTSVLPLRAGQELVLRRIPVHEQRGSVVFETMRRLGWSASSILSAWGTHVEAAGVSILANHYDARRWPPEQTIEAFFPAVGTRWNAYFEPLSSFNGAYAS